MEHIFRRWKKYAHVSQKIGNLRNKLCYAKSLQSCPTLCDSTDSSPRGSPIPGILQARTLEWVAIAFSNEWKWKVKVKSLSRVWLLSIPWTAAYQAPPSMGFSRQKYWSGVPLPSYYLKNAHIVLFGVVFLFFFFLKTYLFQSAFVATFFLISYHLVRSLYTTSHTALPVYQCRGAPAT